MTLQKLVALDTDTSHAILIAGRLTYLPNECSEAMRPDTALIELSSDNDEIAIIRHRIEARIVQ